MSTASPVSARGRGGSAVAESDAIDERIRDLRTSLLVTSGAGCGKTYRMVQRYTAIIEAGVDVTRIIAVTFTEKAAAELRDRVRAQCREMMARTEGAVRERWVRAARRLALAPVTTIHGLCARLLREHALTAGIDPQFALLDETQHDLLLRATVRATLLERLHADEPTARVVVARYGLEERPGTPDAVAVLRELIAEREELGGLLRRPPSAEWLHGRWREAAAEAQAELLARVLADQRWGEVCAALTGIAPVPGDGAGDRQIAFCELQARICAPDAERGERLAALCAALALGHRNAGAKSKWARREAELAEVKAALKTLADLKDEYRAEAQALAQIEDEATAELAAAICAEAAAAARAWEEAKRSRSVLDFADLQVLARDLLVGHPEVRARVRARYEHVLVDEFQDTNHLQKQILWLLAGGDADTGALPRDGRLFVVGDAKQSIYGFRNADVTVFNATLREFAEAPACAVLPLDTSRRSRPELIAFFNDLFSHECVMGTTPGAAYEACYEAVGAARTAPGLPRDVELLLVPDAAPESTDRARLTAHDARLLEAEALAARIREIVDSSTLTIEVEGENGKPVRRAARYGDIGILFQAMTAVPLYEYALRRAGVPFYTVAGHGFYHRQEIRDCLSLLRVIENASDDLSLVGALRSPMFALADDAIFWLTRGVLGLWRALELAAEGRHPHQAQIPGEQVERIARAHSVITGLRAERERMTVAELVERMLTETGLAATYLAQFAGRQAVANLRKLTDLARAFEATGEFSLREFIAWLRDLVVNEQREGLAGVHEEAANVVHLLTVHKAKGLEWPIVIVPDLTRDPGEKGASDPIASPDLGPIPRMELPDGTREWGATGRSVQRVHEERARAERRRLFYVALTRARDYLILSSAFGVKKDGTLSGGVWLQWLVEGLGLDPTTLDGRLELCPTGAWRCVVTTPAAIEAPAAAPRSDARASLTTITEARAAAERGQSEPLPPLARPIPPGPLLPARFTVTALAHFRACPRWFELRHVLGRPEQSGRLDRLRELSPLERGNLAHQALEIIGREAGPAAVERALAIATAPSGLSVHLEGPDRDGLARALRWFLEDARLDDGTPLHRAWVADATRLRSEVDFAFCLDEALIEGAIDALAEYADGSLRVLDYKTGGDPAAETLASYRFQVGLYCAAVEAIVGRPVTDAALVLLDARRVIRFDAPAEAAQAQTEARAIIAAVRRGEFAPRAGCPDDGGRDRCPLAHACPLP